MSGVQALLVEHERKDLLRLLTAGSVDDGKSTLIGRLLYDSKLVYEDHLRSLARDSARMGSAAGDIDYSLLLDGLKAEREQGITIDVAYRYFSTPRRKFIIADTPGHVQYTRNMATGASTADLAVLLVDARHGVVDQTRRHAFIATLLGIRHLVVAVNKMDLVDFSAEAFERVRADFSDFAARLEARDLHFIPISALAGDNVVARSERMPWYDGHSLLHFLETVHIASDRNFIDRRFPVQYVLRQSGDFRGYCGTVASGVFRRGEQVMILPSGKLSRIRSLVTFDGEIEEAHPPMAVTLTLEDQLDVSRGDLLVHPGNVPQQSRDLEAMLVWMAEEPLRVGGQYLVKHGSSTARAEIATLRYRSNVNTLHREQADALELNEIGRVRLVTSRALAYDPYGANRAMGAFILIDPATNGTVAAGMLVDRHAREEDPGALVAPRDVRRRRSLVPAQARAQRLGQRPATLWLTGLPRAGKTSIAYALEERLFELGYTAHVLDGENLRLGLSANLGFAAHQRSEHLRRAAHLAHLTNELGLITIVALISPFAADRKEAREIVGAERFREVHVDAAVEVCAARDTEGLYERARNGEIPNFSGVSAPYEAPGSPDLTLPTAELSIEESVERLLTVLREMGAIGG